MDFVDGIESRRKSFALASLKVLLSGIQPIDLSDPVISFFEIVLETISIVLSGHFENLNFEFFQVTIKTI